MDIEFIKRLNNIDAHAHKLRCYLSILQSYTEKEMTQKQSATLMKLLPIV